MSLTVRFTNAGELFREIDSVSGDVLIVIGVHYPHSS